MSNKRVKRLIILTATLFIFLCIWQKVDLSSPIFFAERKNSFNPLQNKAKEKSKIPQAKPSLTVDTPFRDSYLPPFYQAAVIQALQPPPLKRELEVFFDEEDNNLMVVIDKVVVIPDPSFKLKDFN